jgi:hypothetical protein
VAIAYFVIGKLTSFISAQSSFIFSTASSILAFTHSSNHSSKYSLGTPIFIHFKSLVSHILESIISFQGKDVLSLLSSPFIILYNNAESLTVFVNVPGQSRLDAIGIVPYLEFLQ